MVGSGPAGCSTAILLGRSGLRVALLEAHRDPAHFKRLCTHSIRSSAVPTLRRLGLDTRLDELGAVRHHENGWTKRGWMHERMDAAHGYNIRRVTLDPVLRATAAAIHRLTLLPHQLANVRFSRSASLNPLQRLIYGGAPHDQRVADRAIAVATRTSSPLTLFDPMLLARAAIARRRSATPRRATTPATDTA